MGSGGNNKNVLGLHTRVPSAETKTAVVAAGSNIAFCTWEGLGGRGATKKCARFAYTCAKCPKKVAVVAVGSNILFCET